MSGLTPDQITKFIREYASASSRIETFEWEIPETQDVIQKAVHSFIELTHRPLIEKEQYLSREDSMRFEAFIELCEKLREEKMVDALTDQILTSELFTLYFLLSTGELNDLYLKVQGTTQGQAKDEIVIKTEIAQKYLDKVKERRQGIDWKADMLPELPTVGFEFEYVDALAKLAGLIIDLKSIQDEIWELRKSENGIPRNWGEKETLTHFISKMKDRLNIDPSEKFSSPGEAMRAIEFELRNLVSLFSWKTTIDEYNRNKYVFPLWSASFANDEVKNLPPYLLRALDNFEYRTDYIGRIGLLELHREVSKAILEVSTVPAKTLLSGLKDIIRGMRIGLLPGKVIPQATLSNVELTPEHPEIMDIVPLLAAAGTLQEDSDIVPVIILTTEENDIDAELEDWVRKQVLEYLIGTTEGIHPAISTIVDHFIVKNMVHTNEKSTKNDPQVLDVKETVYPLFAKKIPSSDYIVKVSGKPTARNLVEMRFLPEVDMRNMHDFIRFYRNASFCYLAGWGNICLAIQEGRSDLVLVSIDLERITTIANAWKTLLYEWDKLIHETGLPILEKGKYSVPSYAIRNQYLSTENRDNYEFVKHVNRVLLFADENERQSRKEGRSGSTLRTKTRELIREYQKTVKRFLTSEYLDELKEKAK